MKSKAWLLVLGVSAAIAPIVTPGCGGAAGGAAASSGGGDGDGGKGDTGASRSGGSKSGKGGAHTVSGSGSGGTGTSASSGAGDAGASAGCSSASQYFSGDSLACVTAGCCAAFANCAGAADCIAVLACVVACVSGGKQDNPCFTACMGDAAFSAAAEFDALSSCIEALCTTGNSSGGDDGGRGSGSNESADSSD
jgi:hypothetical protein